MELADDKIRCKAEPERWPIPTPPIVGSPRTDFSQLINCPEFVPRQTLSSTNPGQCSPTHTFGLLVRVHHHEGRVSCCCRSFAAREEDS